MNLDLLALAPIIGVMCTALAAVLMVFITTRASRSADLAQVLRALAEVLRAIWGRR
ncbi:hypothetical protein ACIBCT_30350 [Streptosporangium sp. NPDC050855]|uniref:hypothetical protein n=1 Tax=Streptosporangium sp. NPDC050855 TaxID=3366194 RepID=UPI0037B9A84E